MDAPSNGLAQVYPMSSCAGRARPLRSQAHLGRRGPSPATACGAHNMEERMNDVSRRHWLGSAAILGVAAAVAGTATAQSRPSADDFIRTVKGARMFDLSFTWNEQSP